MITKPALIVVFVHLSAHTALVGIRFMWPYLWLNELLSSLVMSEAISLGLWLALGREPLALRVAYPALALSLILLIHRIPPQMNDVLHFSICVLVPAIVMWMCHKLGACHVNSREHKERNWLNSQFGVADIITCMLMLALVMGFASWGTEPAYVAEGLAVIFGTGIGVFLYRDRNPFFPTLLAIVLSFIVMWPVKMLRCDPFDQMSYFFVGWVSVALVAVSLLPIRLFGQRVREA